MSRITPSTHYQRYQFLRTAWCEFPKLYAVLPLHAQWQIHEFYQPSNELTKAELIAHIKQLTKIKPALVHQAGKHYKRMYAIFRAVSEELDIPKADRMKALGTATQYYKPTSTNTTISNGKYTLSPVARPEIDIHKLAQALWELASKMDGPSDGTRAR